MDPPEGRVLITTVVGAMVTVLSDSLGMDEPGGKVLISVVVGPTVTVAPSDRASVVVKLGVRVTVPSFDTGEEYDGGPPLLTIFSARMTLRSVCSVPERSVLI